MTLYDQRVDSDRASTEHPGKEQDLVLEFGGGVDLMHPPHKLPEGYVRSLINMYYPREAAIPQTRPGAVSHIDDTGTGTQVTAMHVYRKTTTLSYLCFTVINATKQELWYQTGTADPVLIDDDLGSLLTPCMVTFNGALLVAIPGVAIQEWQGFVTGTAARGTANVAFTGAPTADQWLLVGLQTWVAKATRSAPFQFTIGGTAAANATNLAAAINQDSSIIIAVVAGDTVTVVLYARRIGTAGNLVVAENMTNASATGNLTSGVNGLYLDAITSYGYPAPGFLVIDQNLRLVASGDPTYPDTVFFSSPQDPWQWATGVYGNGESFTLGYLDGMDITAIHSQLGDLVVHKSGQGREIYRINTLDPDPSTWTSGKKKFSANTAAVNHRCSVSVTDKHLFLDTRGFSVLTGTDTYDEIIVGGAGGMIADQLSGIDKARAFFVTNPDENYVMVFPGAGKVCWVFHYGSGRWSKFIFKTSSDIACGCYHDALGQVMLGTNDAKILKFDPAYAVDDVAENIFPSIILTRALGDGSLAELLVKQTLISWRNILEGDGVVSLAINNEPSPSQRLFTFSLSTASLQMSDATMVLDPAATLIPLIGSLYGRSNSFTQGGNAGLISVEIKLNQGAAAISGITLRVARKGRAGK